MTTAILFALVTSPVSVLSEDQTTLLHPTPHAWTLFTAITFYSTEKDTVRDEQNMASSPETKTGYEGYKARENSCFGSNVAPDPDHPGPNWSYRVSTLYGPSEIRVSYSYMPTYDIPAMTRRWHHVDWNLERYGEVWFHDTQNLQLTGNPNQDWQIIVGWATGSPPNVQARGEYLYRGTNVVDLIPIEPPPAEEEGGN